MAREMKDSGIPWIGEIPKEWKVVKLRNLGTFSASGIDKKIIEGEELINIINYVDVYNNKSKELKNREYMLVSAPKEKCIIHQVHIGDMIFTPSSETVEDLGLSAVVVENIPNTAYSYHVLRFSSTKELNQNYKKYITNNCFCLSYFSSCAVGTIRKTLSRTVFKECLVLLPSLSEQQSIADFLDKQCGEIDRLVSLQERMIEELKAYKQSVITEAVTKGLNKNVKMKDSGIDWIGEIPEHWKVRRLRTFGWTQNGISQSGDYFGEDYPYPFVSYPDVYKNFAVPYPQGRANSTNEDRLKYSLLEGDVLFTRTSETIEEIGFASTCMDTIPHAVYSGFLIRFRPTSNLLYKGFSKYFFRSNIHRAYFVKEMNLVTRASLSQDLLKSLPVLLPPLSEQISIATYLEKKCGEIDKLIELKQQKIETLKEYKKSVIYEAVTGKKVID